MLLGTLTSYINSRPPTPPGPATRGRRPRRRPTFARSRLPGGLLFPNRTTTTPCLPVCAPPRRVGLPHNGNAGRERAARQFVGNVKIATRPGRREHRRGRPRTCVTRTRRCPTTGRAALRLPCESPTWRTATQGPRTPDRTRFTTLDVPVPCAATPLDIGSDCDVTTTADTVMPGAVTRATARSGRRPAPGLRRWVHGTAATCDDDDAVRYPGNLRPVRAQDAAASAAASSFEAAMIRPMWLKACGKLPSSSPLAGVDLLGQQPEVVRRAGEPVEQPPARGRPRRPSRGTTRARTSRSRRCPPRPSGRRR